MKPIVNHPPSETSHGYNGNIGTNTDWFPLGYRSLNLIIIRYTRIPIVYKNQLYRESEISAKIGAEWT